MAGIESSNASRFVRFSLDVQYGLAQRVFKNNQPVYIYDSSGYFKDANNILVDNIRVLEKGGKYAVLSQAAQGVFNSSSVYIAYLSGKPYGVDEVGVKLCQPAVHST